MTSPGLGQISVDTSTQSWPLTGGFDMSLLAPIGEGTVSFGYVLQVLVGLHCCVPDASMFENELDDPFERNSSQFVLTVLRRFKEVFGEGWVQTPAQQARAARQTLAQDMRPTMMMTTMTTLIWTRSQKPPSRSC